MGSVVVNLRGTVEARTIVSRSRAPIWRDRLPYSITFVRLAEGPSVLAWTPESVDVGQHVRLRMQEDTELGRLGLKLVDAERQTVAPLPKNGSTET